MPVEENFKEIWLADKWVQVKVLRTVVHSGAFSLVKLLDGSEIQLQVETHKLAKWGSHDPESKWKLKTARNSRRSNSFWLRKVG